MLRCINLKDTKMSTKKSGYLLAIIGVTGILASVLVDELGFGDDGIQSAQILGILIGLLIAIFGLSVALKTEDRQIDILQKLRFGIDGLIGLPISFWFLIGFLIIYILLFLMPVFLNESNSMVYFNRFLPNKNPIGYDMNYTLEYVKSWVTTKQSPYPGSHYPPLTYVLLSPLTLVGYPLSYEISILLTFFSYTILTLLIPILFIPKGDFSLVMLLSISGLFSYGFQFELERGQYYSIAFLLCMMAIYLFHRHYEFRYLAYVLFSFSVQLKIMPIFFLPMFIKDWKDWAGNLKRMVGLGLLNIGLLFVLGYNNLVNFIGALLSRVETPTFVWNGNHSLGNFLFNFVRDGYGLFSKKALLLLQQNEKLFEWILLLIIVLCISSIIFNDFKNNKTGFNPNLLLICTLCALMIPVSVDYTLPILVAPTAIFLRSVVRLKGSIKNKIASIMLVLTISVSYASLLYPFKYKPYFLSNSFPVLFLILIAVTMFSFLQNRTSNIDYDRFEQGDLKTDFE